MVETPGEIIVPMRDDPRAGTAEFARCLDAALATRPRVLVLDMTEVRHVSSTTVAMLLWTRRLCAAHGVGVILGEPSRRCREALHRTGLLEVVTDGPVAPRGRAAT